MALLSMINIEEELRREGAVPSEAQAALMDAVAQTVSRGTSGTTPQRTTGGTWTEAQEKYEAALSAVPHTGDGLRVCDFALGATHAVSNPLSHIVYRVEEESRVTVAPPARMEGFTEGGPEDAAADDAAAADDGGGAHPTVDVAEATYDSLAPDGGERGCDSPTAQAARARAEAALDAHALPPTPEELDAARRGLRPLPPDKRLTPQQFYEKFVAVTSEQALAIRRAKQRSKVWFEARPVRMTATGLGPASGNSEYGSPQSFILDKLWAVFAGNEHTDYGTRHEADGYEAFQVWFRAALGAEWAAAGKPMPPAAVQFWEEGLLVRSDMPEYGVSPDFMLRYVTPDGVTHWANGEIKSPSGKRASVTHPYGSKAQALTRGAPMPLTYYCQVQGVAHYLNTAPPGLLELQGLPNAQEPITESWFVVWQPRRTWVTRVAVDTAFATAMFAAAEQTYMRLLVALTHKYNGLLLPGTCVPLVSIEEAPADDDGAASKRALEGEAAVPAGGPKRARVELC